MYFWLGLCEFSHRLVLCTFPIGINTCRRSYLIQLRFQRFYSLVDWNPCLQALLRQRSKKYLVRNSGQISSWRSNSDWSMTAESNLVCWNEEQAGNRTSSGWEIALECMQQLLSFLNWEILSENSLNSSSLKNLCAQAQFPLYCLWNFGP